MRCECKYYTIWNVWWWCFFFKPSVVLTCVGGPRVLRVGENTRAETNKQTKKHPLPSEITLPKKFRSKDSRHVFLKIQWKSFSFHGSGMSSGFLTLSVGFKFEGPTWPLVSKSCLLQLCQDSSEKALLLQSACLSTLETLGFEMFLKNHNLETNVLLKKELRTCIKSCLWLTCG